MATSRSEVMTIPRTSCSWRWIGDHRWCTNVVFVTPIMDPYVCTISGSAAVCLRSPTSDISLLVMSFESRTVHLRVLEAMSVTSGPLQNPYALF